MACRLLDIKKWPYAVVICFVIAMLATPADPLSMILVALPLCGLYFLAVGLCTYFNRKCGRGPVEGE